MCIYFTGPSDRGVCVVLPIQAPANQVHVLIFRPYSYGKYLKVNRPFLLMHSSSVTVSFS